MQHGHELLIISCEGAELARMRRDADLLPVLCEATAIEHHRECDAAAMSWATTSVPQFYERLCSVLVVFVLLRLVGPERLAGLCSCRCYVRV